jgi:hypothetical protein
MKCGVYKDKNGVQMTCRYSGTDWLDVLYTSVRNTPGGVADAAAFLTGKSIGTESLRLRLRGEGENRLSMEMFELLVEWMEEKHQPHFVDAIHALNGRFGLRATSVDADDDHSDVERVALDALELTRQTGIVAGEVREAIGDRKITVSEADAIVVAARAQQGVIDRLVGAVLRISKSGRQ